MVFAILVAARDVKLAMTDIPSKPVLGDAKKLGLGDLCRAKQVSHA